MLRKMISKGPKNDFWIWNFDYLEKVAFPTMNFEKNYNKVYIARSCGKSNV